MTNEEWLKRGTHTPREEWDAANVKCAKEEFDMAAAEVQLEKLAGELAGAIKDAVSGRNVLVLLRIAGRVTELANKMEAAGYWSDGGNVFWEFKMTVQRYLSLPAKVAGKPVKV